MRQEALPIYLQIAKELRQNIQESVFKVGDRLPTEYELSERFGVNRHTLRRAVEVLRQEGIVDVERGRGTFVVSAPITFPIGKRVRFNEALKSQSLNPTFQVLRVAELEADVGMAKAMALEPGDSVVLMERLSFIEEVPISLSSSHFPSHLFPGLVEHCQTYSSISKMLRQEYDCDHIRKSTKLTARLPMPQEARLLRMPASNPIMLSESINVNQAGQVIEYGVTRFRGDRMELVIDNTV